MRIALSIAAVFLVMNLATLVALRRRLATDLRRVGSETELFWTCVQNAYR